MTKTYEYCQLDKWGFFKEGDMDKKIRKDMLSNGWEIYVENFGLILWRKEIKKKR
jgi:hypothetical protein